MLTEAALICLTLNTYHEARGESITGQYAVVHVVRNRAKYNPENVCKVVFAPYQFSWTITVPGENYAVFNRLLHITKLAWESPADITHGATHYHVRPGCPGGVRPYWTAKMKVTVRIGCHIYYRKKSWISFRLN